AVQGAASAAPQQPGPTASALDDGFFDRTVRPLLEKHCLGCHGVGTRLSGLDLRSREAALKGGTRGPALIPGSAEKSLLYRLVTGRRAPVSPPPGKPPAADIQTLKRWLDNGAPWSKGTLETATKQVWWAFKPPVLPPIPGQEARGKRQEAGRSHLLP